MLADICADDLASTLDACAAETLWQAGIDRPPVDARLVAERLGLIVATHRRLPHRAQFVRLSAGQARREAIGTIVVGPAERPEREQWAIAHEIGECLAPDVFARIGTRLIDAPAGARESIANRLASCLLLPRRWYAADGRAFDWDLFELKERYATASHELIARRMLEQEPPVVITVCDQGRITWRRDNMAFHSSRMSPVEQEAWERTRNSARCTDITPDPLQTGLDRVRAWPVHEPNWKREIIRGEIALY
jgi:Zn-dependent peptidase ImmA (M78 family)